MSGYINGKVEIWCGDFPPINQNILWYKRIIDSENRDYYLLMEFDRHERQWREINTSTKVVIATDQDGAILTTQDNFILRIN